MCACLLAGALCAGAPAAIAQFAYPSRKITLVVPFSPGGGTELVAWPGACAVRSAILVLERIGVLHG
jgi:tripartite-type tricarboxylate transporter receptor subunit TctC